MAGFSSYLALAPLTLAATVLAGPAALAASPGSGGQAGPVSMASVRISLTVAPRLQAERAEPADAGVESAASPAQPLCIWSNAPAGTFSVTASQVGEADGPAASRPAYELEWRDGTGGSRAVPVLAGTKLSDLAAESRRACQGQGRPTAALTMRPVSGAERASGEGAPVFLLLISPD